MGHEQKYCKVPRLMSTYCNSFPKYDQSIQAQPAKTITVILKEHKQRYGDSTKNTAHKSQTKYGEEDHSSTNQGESEFQEESEEVVRERVRRAWAEMIANCSSGTGTVPDTFGKSTTGIHIRDFTLEDSLKNTPEQEYLMAYI